MKNWIFICLATAAVSALSFTPGHANEPEAQAASNALEEAPEPILPSAHFGQKDLRAGFEVVVGRLVLHRHFMGTRADPMYHDSVRFRFFDGSELSFLKLADEKLEQQMIEQLRAGRSLPAVLTVDIERVRVGHDGINVSQRLVPRVETCLLTSVDLVCAAAKDAGFDVEACNAFANAVEPDVSQDGIAVSLDRVTVRPKTPPRWKTSAVFIDGIRVFNTTPDNATIEIIGLTIEQDDVTQACSMDPQKSPRTWRVAAKSWSDGVYAGGEMPQNRWRFNPSRPIDPGEKVTVHLEIKINGGEKMSLKRTVEPMSLKQ